MGQRKEKSNKQSNEKKIIAPPEVGKKILPGKNCPPPTPLKNKMVHWGNAKLIMTNL